MNSNGIVDMPSSSQAGALIYVIRDVQKIQYHNFFTVTNPKTLIHIKAFQNKLLCLTSTITYVFYELAY